MAIYKFSNVGGFGTYQRYNDFLAGNPAVILDNGAYFPLGEFTLASAQANIEFTNIPQTYKHLQIRGIARDTAANTGLAGLFIQFNLDTGSNYARHNLVGNGSSASATAATSTTFLILGQSPRNNETAGRFGGFVCDILDYQNTNKYKTTRSLLGSDLNGSGEVRLTSGLWQSSSAITSIKIYSENGNLAQYSSFALFGVLA
jgi:hypothetical protein